MDKFKCPVCGCEDYYESKEGGRIRRRCRVCQKERMKKIYATEEYKAKHRIDDRRRRRNCTAEKYGLLLEKQKGKCAICGKVCWSDLRADHDHKTGAVRGLLCDNCNWGLGNFKDNQTYLRNAISYLEQNEED